MNVDPVHASSAGIKRQPAEKKLHAAPFSAHCRFGEYSASREKSFSFGHDREVRIRRGEKQWV
jgi:hypothetical protein